MSPGRMEGLDVDPEAVRAALRDFMSQLANAERERVSVCGQGRLLSGKLFFVVQKMLSPGNGSACEESWRIKKRIVPFCLRGIDVVASRKLFCFSFPSLVVSRGDIVLTKVSLRSVDQMKAKASRDGEIRKARLPVVQG